MGLRLNIVGVFVLLTVSSLRAGPGEQVEIWRDSPGGSYLNGYLEYLPPAYDGATRYPLVIFIHGLGDCGVSADTVGKSDLQKVGTLAGDVPNTIKYNINHGLSNINAIVISPQLMPWANLSRGFVDFLVGKYAVDTNRIYMTGLSMGGGTTWNFARANPGLLAAIVPVCGAPADSPHDVESMKDLPIWAFHNDNDPVVDCQSTTVAWISAITACGGTPVPLMTIYHSALHNCWSETYARQDMWDWLFAQSKTGLPPDPPTKRSQTIDFPPMAGKTYGDAPFELPERASSGLLVSYSSDNSAVATVSGHTVALAGAGSATLIASQPGNAVFDPAAAVTQTVTVAKQTLAATADSMTRLCGASNPVFTVFISGFVNGDTLSVLDCVPVAHCVAMPCSLPGAYPITVTGGSDSNYAFSYVEGRLTIASSNGYQAIRLTTGKSPNGVAGWEYDQPYVVAQSRGWGNNTAFDIQGYWPTIAGTTNQALYSVERWGDFSYEIPVDNGACEVTLHFVELFVLSAGARTFDVTIEGATVLNDFDIVAEAGGRFKAVRRTFEATVTNGVLHMNFIGAANSATVSGIEIVRIRRGFDLWAAAHGLEGDRAALYAGDRDGDGTPNGIEYAYNSNAGGGEPLLDVKLVDGAPVADVLIQQADTAPYVRIGVEACTNLAGNSPAWNLPTVLCPATAGRPEGHLWYEAGGRPGRAYFRIRADLLP